MSLLDTLAPRRGPKQRRYGGMFVAKTTFYVAVFAAGVFVLASFVLFDKDREVPVIPATRVEAEVIVPVREFLKARNVPAYGDSSTILNCWDEFGGREFTAEYLNYGSWRIDAFYDRVRYYWRVDDATLEVTRDDWVNTKNPTIEC